MRDKRPYLNRGETDVKGPHADRRTLQKTREARHAKEPVTWAEVGPGRSAQAGRPGPFRGPVTSPFDLAAIGAIYSPRVESHASFYSSSATEEQRTEEQHLGEERVELVD